MDETNHRLNKLFIFSYRDEDGVRTRKGRLLSEDLNFFEFQTYKHSYYINKQDLVFMKSAEDNGNDSQTPWVDRRRGQDGR